MENSNGVTSTFVVGSVLFGSSAVSFCWLAYQHGATMPLPTLVLLLGGLAAFTIDCYRKGLREYLVFNGLEFLLYAGGGLMG